MDATNLGPIALLRPGRKIEGASAILLPFDADGSVDWQAFDAHVARTVDAGLAPAVNMDTGYVNLIDANLQSEVIRRTGGITAGRPFFAGAFVADRPGDRWDRDATLGRVGMIAEGGGIPVIFPSFGLAGRDDEGVIAAHAEVARHCDGFLGFELAKDFNPAGRIYSMDVFRGLMAIPECLGIKHSSLRREPEWRRLIERDRLRPGFRVYTGNDLAIDMVMYGSDYLLGLSTFAPDLFAARDAMWLANDPAFYELNDALQYLGAFAFRPPVPAYKHSAAMFLKLRGWSATDRTHPESPTRPRSDREVLRELALRLTKP